MVGLALIGDDGEDDAESVNEAVKDAQQDVEDLDQSQEDWEPDESREDGTDAGSSRGKMKAELEKLKAQVEAVKEQQESMSSRNDRLNERIGSLRENLKDVQEDVEMSASKASRAENMMEELQPEKIDEKLGKKDQEIEALKGKVQEKGERIHSLQQDMNDLRSTVKELGSIKSVKNIRDEAKQMLETVKKLESRSELNANKVEDIFHELQAKSGKIEEALDKANSLENQVLDLQKAVNDVQVKYENFPNQDEFNDRMDEVWNEIDGMKEFAAALQNAFSEVENVGESKVLTRQDLKSFREDLGSRLEEMEVEDLILESKMEQEFEELEERITEEVLAERLEGIRNEIDHLHSNHEKLGNSVQKIKQGDDTELKQKISGNREELDELREEIEELTRREDVIETELDERLEEISPGEEMEKRIEALENRIETVKEDSETGDLERSGENVPVEELESLRRRVDEMEESMPPVTEERLDSIEQRLEKLGQELNSREREPSEKGGEPRQDELEQEMEAMRENQLEKIKDVEKKVEHLDESKPDQDELREFSERLEEYLEHRDSVSREEFEELRSRLKEVSEVLAEMSHELYRYETG